MNMMEGEGQGGEPYPFVYNETTPWSIRSYTDPNGQSMEIIDGRVIIAWKEYTPVPHIDPNYYDNGLAPTDPFLQNTVYPSTRLYDLDIAAFIAAENLTPYSEWTPIASAAFLLPQGQTVEDAVQNWPLQYPDLIDSVIPDSLGETCAFPFSDPNDDRYGIEWAVNDTYGSLYHINVRQAWKVTHGLGWSYVGIAVLDTGVDASLADLQTNSDGMGCNIGDSQVSTEFKARTQGGGEPWPWVKNTPGNADDVGHGTCCAGEISARIDNDPGFGDDDRDIAGVCQNCFYFPVAMKGFNGNFGKSVALNALTALACIRGRYNPKVIYGPNTNCPQRNIEVASNSWGFKIVSKDTPGDRILNDIAPYTVVVASAGNNGTNAWALWPSNHPQSCCVAAYDMSGQRAHWGGGESSNYHIGTVDIAAPDSAISTCDMRGQNPWYEDFGYAAGVNNDNFRGTSAAAPYVAGAAALVTGKYVNKSPAQVRQRLVDTRLPLPGDLNFCDHVNVMGALTNPWP